jgi:hypothetical protein
VCLCRVRGVYGAADSFMGPRALINVRRLGNIYYVRDEGDLLEDIGNVLDTI